MRYFFSLKNKTENKQLPPLPCSNPHCILCYCLLTVSQDSPHLQFPSVPGPPSTSLALPASSAPGHLTSALSPLLFSTSPSWPNPGIWEPFLAPLFPSLLRTWSLPPPLLLALAQLNPLWPLPGLFQWPLNWFPQLQPLLGSIIKPTPATVIFLESSAQATSLLKLLQGLPLVDKVESTLFEEGLQG